MGLPLTSLRDVEGCFGAQAQGIGVLTLSFTALCTLLMMLTLLKHLLVARASPPTSAAPWATPGSSITPAPPAALGISLVQIDLEMENHCVTGFPSQSLRSTRNVSMGLRSPVRCSDDNETSG